jgi:hypothetical protein
MPKNAIIAILGLAIIVLVAGFLMRGPNEPAGTGTSLTPAPSNGQTATDGPTPPAAAPRN